MSTFGKPDAKGRSSGILKDKDAKHLRPPKGLSWTWQTMELLESEAWRGMSINARRALDRVLIEHMAHAGQQNGQLPVTHSDFYSFGIPKDAIRPAVEELIFLGLIRSVRGGRWAGTNRPSTFRITWIGNFGSTPPSNEWKGITQEHIELRKQDLMNARKRKEEHKKKQIPAPTLRGATLRVVGVSARGIREDEK